MGAGTSDVVLPIVETDTGTDRKQIRLYPREEHAPLVMLYRRLPDGPPHQVLMRTVLAHGMVSSEFATFLQGMGLDVEEYLPSFPVAA